MEVPDGFTTIEFDLYHAFRVGSINYSFLKSLNLHTILVLDSGAPSRSLTEFAESNDIRLIHLVAEVWRSANEDIQQHHTLTTHSHALKYVLDARNYPILVLGTSLITGIIRRLERWNVSSIMSDYGALAEVTGVFIKLSDMCLIELMEFEGGSVDDAPAIIAAEAGSDPLKSVVVVDMPERKHQADWVTNFEPLPIKRKPRIS